MTGDTMECVPAHNGQYHPMGFMSKGFSDIEHHYQIYDKELLAIVHALEEWRHFLEGTTLPFKIHTDHQNLSYFRSPQNLNRRQAHWSLYLSWFNFTLLHKPGLSMKKSDALSCCPDHPKGEHDNDNVTLLLPSHFQIQTTMQMTMIMSKEESLLTQIWSCPDHDDIVSEAKQHPTQSEDWEVKDGLITYRGCLYVLKDPKLRHDVVHLHHNSATTGHPSHWKTLELLSWSYWWPGIVLHCKVCSWLWYLPTH